MMPTAPPFRLPPLREARLDCGLRVVVAHTSSLPSVDLRLTVDLPVPAERLAAAELLSRVLFRGRSQPERPTDADRLTRRGARLTASRSGGRLHVVAQVPVAGLDDVLEVLWSSLAEPRFDASELAGARQAMLGELAVVSADPGVLGETILLERLFAGADWLREVPTAGQVAATGLDDVRTVHRTALHPGNASLVLVGDVHPDEWLERSRAGACRWRPDGPAPVPVPPTAHPVSRHEVDAPGATQTRIRLLAPGLDRDDDDFGALTLATMVLGGTPSSRLMTRLRERDGLVYRVSVGTRDIGGAPVVDLAADADNALARRVVERMLEEVDGLSAEPPTRGELAGATRFLAGTVAAAAASQAGLTASLAAAARYGFPSRRMIDFLVSLSRIEPTEVARTAAQVLRPERFSVVLVGDRDAWTAPVSEGTGAR